MLLPKQTSIMATVNMTAKVYQSDQELENKVKKGKKTNHVNLHCLHQLFYI